jgi:hypothetical protein
MEGTHCFNPATDCDDGTLTFPIIEYDHSIGCSITGGYRYRGTRNGDLFAVYLYADYCSGRIWGAIENDNGGWMVKELLDTDFRIATFGEDETGEIYVADYVRGAIYRIEIKSKAMPWIPLLLVDD